MYDYSKCSCKKKGKELDCQHPTLYAKATFHHAWEKKKLLFTKHVLQAHKNKGLFGKGLVMGILLNVKDFA